MTKYARKCPTCGEEVLEKEVTEVLSGEVNTAFVRVQVGVCLHCGERLYTPDTVRRFEEIEAKLQRQDTAGFRPLGKSFQVTAFE
ncbi:MAG: YgiT-type zinc finger protein [bacterium]